MTPVTRYKPGASRRERSPRERGKWVSRPYGTKARETRQRDRRAWHLTEGADR